MYVPARRARSGKALRIVSIFLGASALALHWTSHISCFSGKMATRSIGVRLLAERITIFAPFSWSCFLAFLSIS